MSLKLALDAMGGDDAPQIVIEGASIALAQGIKAEFHFFGDEQQILPLLSLHKNLKDHAIVHHTEEFVSNDMKAVQAIRGLRRSSMRLAIEAVLERQAHAVISAGNTGAYMALAKILLKTLEGVDRPAIAATIPTVHGSCVGLDLGANIDCTVVNLVQFAIMGDALARRVLHKPNPRIGLLNVGSEELKGSAVVQQASQELKEIPYLNYIGFVEGDDITLGDVDVVVTDGFTGNVALKTIEGVAKFVMGEVKGALASSWRGKLGYTVARPAFKDLRNLLDPRLYNGAAFLGLKGIAVKSHGGADAVAFANAIKVTADLASEEESLDIAHEIEAKLKEI